MTECLWIKRGNSLVPAGPWTEDLLAKTPNGARVFTSAPYSRRNPDFHNWAMSRLQEVVDNTDDRFADVSDLMFELKMRTGMFSKAKDYAGRLALVPRSVSFAAMGEAQFRRVWQRWLYIIQTEIMPGYDADAAERAERESAA